MIERGTGRTLAMVKSLPETESIVIVHTAEMRRYITRMIRDVRGQSVADLAKVCLVETVADVIAALAGNNSPVFVDHAFDWEDTDGLGPIIAGIISARATVQGLVRPTDEA